MTGWLYYHLRYDHINEILQTKKKKGQFPVVNSVVKWSAAHRIRCQTKQQFDGQHVTNLLNPLWILCWEICCTHAKFTIKRIPFEITSNFTKITAHGNVQNNGKCDSTFTLAARMVVVSWLYFAMFVPFCIYILCHFVEVWVVYSHWKRQV